jgi:hypothetical protein
MARSKLEIMMRTKFPRYDRYLVFVRFMKFAKFGDINECWEWKGGKIDEYGQFVWKEKNICMAHQASYELFVGRRHGKKVLHTCDNPICWNPNHLFLGTNKDNTHDMISKNRDTIVGERNNNAKLTEYDVKKLLKLYNTGNYTKSRLAIKFDISNVQVGNIISGKSWGRSASNYVH